MEFAGKLDAAITLACGSPAASAIRDQLLNSPDQESAVDLRAVCAPLVPIIAGLPPFQSTGLFLQSATNQWQVTPEGLASEICTRVLRHSASPESCVQWVERLLGKRIAGGIGVLALRGTAGQGTLSGLQGANVGTLI